MRFDAIIFDFDGVIVDSETIANAALAELLTAQGHPTSREEALSSYCGLNWTDCHKRIEAETGRRFDREALGDLLDAAVAARAGEVLAIEGLADFVAANAHRRLAIASSSETAWLETTLSRLGLLGWFEARLFSAAGFARGKPHPDIYLHAAAQLGADPPRCLVIEDHPVGVAAGAAAGMTVVALLAGGHIGPGHAERVSAAGAHYVAGSYDEVAEILAQIER
jgi:HAD superfamily hydrolase (TIGR01509 family)